MMLQLRQVSHGFGKRNVLEDIALEVAEGEFVCLAGESGCGKSTLLRLIAGLERPRAGEIHLNNRTLSSPEIFVPAQKRAMGLVFQQAALFPHLSVIENVCFGMKPVSLEAAHALLEQIRFAGREQDYPHMLSGGQQQRVALARALAAEPSLLLLDEPFASLDYDLRKKIRADIHALLRERGITTLMVTHDPQEAMQMADRIILLSPQGRIEQVGTPKAIYQSPGTDYAARFFGPANFIQINGVSRMVRPENIRLQETGQYTGTIRKITFSGSHQLIELAWDNQVLLAKDYRQTEHQSGSTVRFSLYEG
jgi:iron(III) transport system ATP-binding protein